MVKTAQNLTREILLDFVPGFFFVVGIGVSDASTKLCACMWNIALEALPWNFIGGAIEPFCHTHFWKPYQI